MKVYIILFSFILAFGSANAQLNKNAYAPFPQQEMNQAAKTILPKQPQPLNQRSAFKPASNQSTWSMLKKIQEVKNMRKVAPDHTNWVQSHDTIFVGVVPNDTLKITGNWTHNGPILVFNDGVLVFKNAAVIDSGDIYVFQNGQLIADSSSLTFPQQYFYQRSLIAVQNAVVKIQHCSFNYSGMSHNLVLGNNANVTLNNIHEHDWTTCGLYGKPTLSINGCNQAGEYILSDSSSASFKNTDTLLLWHHFPDTAVVNFSFPNGTSVYNYQFNKTIPSVHGVEYNVFADSCNDVMWAMMPVNGSDVTISNSTIRAIGAWFQHGDTANVSNLYDNSNYSNFTAPLSDRNLHMINTSVQTWNLYAFDNSSINMDSCQVGEVGTENKAGAYAASSFLLDGSGGYFWATDTSSVFALGATVYSYVRSERNGLFIFAYGNEPFTAPQAIGNSILIDVQSASAADPVAYDAATAWLDKIDGPDTSYTNANIQVTGSAWINWGPAGTGWMDFNNYSLYYQQAGDTTWNAIIQNVTSEVSHATLANWNTSGLVPGTYILKLTLKDNFNDSVEAEQLIYLQPGTLGLNAKERSSSVAVYPNPTKDILYISYSKNSSVGIEIYTVMGQKLKELTGNLVDMTGFSPGVYYIKVSDAKKNLGGYKVIKDAD